MSLPLEKDNIFSSDRKLIDFTLWATFYWSIIAKVIFELQTNKYFI